MKERYKKAHMSAAIGYANLSYCERRKVGCLIVKDDTPIAVGYNGTPSGEDNCCEEKLYSHGDEGGWLDVEEILERWPSEEFDSKANEIRRYRIVTKHDVVHAEDNALRKLTHSTESAEGSSVFVTTAPCKQCAVRLKDAKVKEVFYLDVYRNTDGLEYLEKHGIHTEQINMKNKQD